MIQLDKLNERSKDTRNKKLMALLKNTDMCVSCGMCLPHCPTYQIARLESESPRGRLSLIKASLTLDLDVDDNMLAHLDHCLLCGSCESICPVDIPFVKIIDDMRTAIYANKKIRPVWKRILFALVADRRKMQRMMGLFTGLHIGRVLKLFSRISKGSLFRYLQIASMIRKAPQWQQYYPARGDERRTVALFLGCLQEHFDPDTLSDAIGVLNELGISVIVPAEQQCCGALHSHSGKSEIAMKLFNANKSEFGELHFDEIVSLSSACTVTLNEYERDNGESASGFHVSDLTTYLEKIRWFENRSLQSVHKKIVLHYPCTQKNALRNTDTVDMLLSRIPGMTISRMPGNIKCCGAAGMFSLDYPEWSDKLAGMAIESIAHDDYDAIITSNIGCALQFMKMSRSQKQVKVLHPVSLVSHALGL